MGKSVMAKVRDINGNVKEIKVNDGDRASAYIRDQLVEGVLTVEGSGVYLCQNMYSGKSCMNKKGMTGSWCISGCTDHRDFKLLSGTLAPQWESFVKV